MSDGTPDLLQRLLADGESFAEHELPSLADVSRMFKPLVARLEVALPDLAERELTDLIGKSTAAPAAVEQAPAAAGAATSIQTQPATAVEPDLSPQERAAKLRAEADALDPEQPPAQETTAQRLRREADEAEREEIQAEALSGTATGAEGAAVTRDGEQARATQDSGS